MLFDTHCHLNFQAFNNNLKDVIEQAKKTGVNNIVIPGTDIETSNAAIEIAKKHEGIYAAVGIHPHHIMQYQISKIKDQKYILKIKNDLKKTEKLLINKKVVAVGEVGMDRHIYEKTKYQDYKIEEEFIKLQKKFLKEQIKLAIKYDKSLILHNREAREDTLEVLENVWDKKLEGRTVFHCCEPDMKLLEFAKEHKVFIGVDGDVTYLPTGRQVGKKAEFIKKVPLDMLVLETDSPFLMPRSLSILRPLIRYNEPKNIILIAEFIAKLKDIPIKKISEMTTENARKLFKI